MVRVALLGTMLLVSGCGSSETSEQLGCPSKNLLTDVSNCGACGHSCAPGVGCFAGACTSPSPMPTARTGMQAATLPDGRIIVIGGGSGNGASSSLPGSVEIYDPTSNTWTSGEVMPTPRAFIGIAVRDGMVIVAGGQGDADPSGVDANVHSTVEIYDPVADTWATGPELVEPRQDAPLVVTSDRRTWAIWGGSLDETPIESMEVQEPGAAWQLKATIVSPPRWGARAFPAPDGKIYVLGGVGYQVSVVYRKLVTYDPASDGWEDLQDSNVGHGLGAAALGIDGRLYFAGGLSESHEPSDSAERYDPSTNVWEPIAPLPFGLVDTTAATGLDGRIYVVGGTAVLAAPEATELMLVYDPELDQWFQ